MNQKDIPYSHAGDSSHIGDGTGDTSKNLMTETERNDGTDCTSQEDSTKEEDKNFSRKFGITAILSAAVVGTLRYAMTPSYGGSIELKRYGGNNVGADTSFNFGHGIDRERFPVSIYYDRGKRVVKIKTKDGWEPMPKNEDPKIRIKERIEKIQGTSIDSTIRSKINKKLNNTFYLLSILEDMPSIKNIEYGQNDEDKKCKITVKFSDIGEINFSNLMKELEKVIPDGYAVDLQIK